MRRITIKGLQADAERSNKEIGQGCNNDWFDNLVESVENGNLTHVKEEIECMSKRDTLKVISTAVDRVDCSQHEDRDIMRVYNYALASLERKLTGRAKK